MERHSSDVFFGPVYPESEGWGFFFGDRPCLGRVGHATISSPLGTQESVVLHLFPLVGGHLPMSNQVSSGHEQGTCTFTCSNEL